MKLLKVVTATGLVAAMTLAVASATDANSKEEFSTWGFGNSIKVNYDERVNSCYTLEDQELRFSANPGMSTYFQNLVNIGANEYGSCGYVGIGMLLSYYDTFWCDDFIDEKYDYSSLQDSNRIVDIYKSSPGVKNESKSSTSPKSNRKDIIKRAEKLANDGYFIPYLITLGNKAKFYSEDFDDNIPYFDQANRICEKKYGERYNYDAGSAGGFSCNQIGDFLKYYLDNETRLKNMYKIESKSIKLNVNGSTDDTEMRKFVAKYIDEGYPVLIGTSRWYNKEKYNITSESSDFELMQAQINHIEVAYDYIYDSQYDRDYDRYQIIGHHGTFDKEGSVNSYDTVTDYITEAYVLIPSFSKLGSDNYGKYNGKAIDSLDVIKYVNVNKSFADFFTFKKRVTINSVEYYAPNPQHVSFKTNENFDTYFSNINLSYDEEYSYHTKDYLLDLLKWYIKPEKYKEPVYEDYKYLVKANIFYSYRDDYDMDYDNENFDENAILYIDVNSKRNNTRCTFDVGSYEPKYGKKISTLSFTISEYYN